MNLGNLDLNLMRALDALLREANVTRAAERLNLTQPTLSASLSKLRRHFGDDLLWRNGNRLELTPLGSRLRPLVAEAVDSAQRLFEAHRVFDPLESTRRYSIVASDYGLGVVGVALSKAVSAAAPTIRVVVRALPMDALSPMEVRSRDVDGLIAPHGFVSVDLPHMDLFRDRWVLIADETNTLVGDEPTLDELAQVPWASAFEGPRPVPSGLAPGEWAGFAPELQVVVDSFTSLPLCVRGTTRVAMVQERLIDALGARTGLRVLQPPFSVEPISVAFWWHSAFESDPEHAWLRVQLEQFREIATEAPA